MLAVHEPVIASDLELAAQFAELPEDLRVLMSRVQVNYSDREPVLQWADTGGRDRHVARGLPLHATDHASRLRRREAASPDRTAEAPTVDRIDRAAARDGVRRSRRRRQGRHHQADRRASQPTRHHRRGVEQADRARAVAVVLPALHRSPALERGDRHLRPLVVQPGRRRAGDGVLHRRRVRRVPPLRPELRRGARAVGRAPREAVVLGVASRAANPVRHPSARPGCGSGSSRRSTWRRSTSGTTTPPPRRRCSMPPTPTSHRGS